MISLFNLKGYDGYDPLDQLTSKKLFAYSWIVSFTISAIFLYLIFFVLKIALIPQNWYYVLECIILASAYFPIVILLRKSSSILIMFLLLASMIPIDLFLQSHYRQFGMETLWSYNPTGPIGGLIPLAQIFVAWIIDAFVFGPVTLWVARVLANFKYKESVASKTRRKLYSKIFTKDQSFEQINKPKYEFSFWILRILGIIYFSYLILVLIGLLGTSAYPQQLRVMLEMTYENPNLAINTIIKLSIMTTLCFIGAYNVSLRYHTSLVLMFGHLISTVFSLFFYYYNTPANLLTAPYRDFLMTSAIVDGVLIILFVMIMVKYRSQSRLLKDDDKYPSFYTLPNRLMKTFYYVFGSILGLIVLLIFGARVFLEGDIGWAAVYGFPDSQICNSLTKYATYSFLAFLIAGRKPLRKHLYKVFLVGYGVSVIVSAVWLLSGSIFGDILVNTRIGIPTTTDWYFMVNVVIDGAVVALILGLRKMYFDVDYSIKALSPSNARAVIALHETLYDGTPEESSAILVSIDNHVGATRGRKRGLLNFPFWSIENFANLIFGFYPSFSTMDLENRKYFLRKYVLRPPNERAKSYIPILADLVYKLGTAVHALITMAHYNNLKAKSKIGFVPIEARDRLQSDYALAPPPFKQIANLPKGPNASENFQIKGAGNNLPLVANRVVTPVKEEEIPLEVDYVVIGSGAGGAVAAYRLAQKFPGSEILLIERGPRYSPLQDFNDDELDMVRKLYKEGGIQQTKRFDLTVFQGECLGGTTVINNAICFEMPDEIKQKWTEKYDLNLDDLAEEYKTIAEEIGIETLPESSINQVVLEKFKKGIKGHNQNTSDDTQLHEESLKANTRNNLGDGADNLGNKRMRKRSMLETYIPWAEANGVKIVCNVSAVKFENTGNKVNSLLLRTNIGTYKNLKIRKAAFIGCGTIASSHLLLRSNITKNVGKGMSCNFAFPVAFEFDEKLKAFDGSQITYGAIDKQYRAVFETYFNPPATFAASIPFYFERLQSKMNKYEYMVNFGALVGSEPNGTIELKTDWINGRSFKWELGEIDRSNIKYAFKTLLSIGKNAGAKSCTLPMDPGVTINLNDKDINEFITNFENFPLEMSDLRLTTAHPQGGNIMTGDNSNHKKNRAIDSNFKVEGFENLYVCDASIFPTGITINPQWTIMALSSLAIKRM